MLSFTCLFFAAAAQDGVPEPFVDEVPAEGAAADEVAADDASADGGAPRRAALPDYPADSVR